MRFSTLLLFATLMVNGQSYSGLFNGSSTLSFTPSSAAAQQFGSYRIDFRIASFSVLNRVQGIVGNNSDTQCVLVQDTLDIRCRNWHGGDPSIQINLAGRTDVRVRYQRDNSTKLESLEVWNGDGSGYVAVTRPIAPMQFNAVTQNFVGSVWGSGSEFIGRIDFVRWYSSTLPLNSTIPPDVISPPANILDLEFDNNLLDTSSGTLAITLAGSSIPFSLNPAIAPVARVVGSSVKTGSIAILDGSGSTSLSSIKPLVSSWTCVSSPSPCVITQSDSLVASLSASSPGTYQVELTVRDDNGRVGVTTVEIGSVPSDNFGRVILPSPEIELSIGPLTQNGSSPWEWFDKTEIAAADSILSAIPASPGDTPLSGSISVEQGSSTITGSGTSFRTQFACNGSDRLMIHYPVPGEAPGRRVYTVVSCASDSQMTIYPAYDASSNANGVQFARASEQELSQWVNGSNNWNYYDAVMALYRAYYRTGFDRYRKAARSLADKWYVYPLDRGRAWKTGSAYYMLAPRTQAMTGIMLRANDGKPEYWDAITTMGEWGNTWLSGWYPWNHLKEVGELREQGYVSLATAQIAILHPSASVRTRFSNYALAQFNNYWRPTQNLNGGWYFSLGANQNYYGLGTLAWQGAFAGTYLVALHRLTGNSEVLSSLKKYADFMALYGIDPSNDGGFYDSFYQFCPDYGAESQGSISVTKGSTLITGNQTNFRVRFAFNGGDSIAIQDTTGFRRLYKVASCASDGSLQISAPYAGASETGLRHLKYANATNSPPDPALDSTSVKEEGDSLRFSRSGPFGTYSWVKKKTELDKAETIIWERAQAKCPATGCGVCPWGTCGTFGAGSATDARAILSASHAYWGYLYSLGQGTRYKEIGDRIFAKNLGPNGPGGDLQHGHYDEAISNPNVYLSKSFAFAGGAAGAQPYLAWRLGSNSTMAKTSVPIGRRNPQGTVTARLALKSPDGSESEIICVEGTCVAEVDKAAGTSPCEIQYQNLDGAVGSRTGVRILNLEGG